MQTLNYSVMPRMKITHFTNQTGRYRLPIEIQVRNEDSVRTDGDTLYHAPFWRKGREMPQGWPLVMYKGKKVRG